MRPTTGNRLKTGQIPTPIGTATRLTTGVRPGTRGSGSGVTLNTALRVEERPITQQGLSGLKMGTKGPRRQIEDRSYFFGVLRSKINEITSELNKFATESEKIQKENESYSQYEQMAEQLATEIKNLQGELGDYNTLVDKATIGHDIASIELDWEDIKMANERSEQKLERLFEERQNKEMHLKSIQLELEQEQSIAASVVEGMTDEEKSNYFRLRELNQHLLTQLDEGRITLEQLLSRRTELEDDIANSRLKQEAMRLYGQLHEVEAKHSQLLSEAARREDPQKEREMLLVQVREDNRETAHMEQQIRELKEKISESENILCQINQEIEDHQSERSQKFRELKQREQQIDQFLQSFETAKTEEMDTISGLQNEIVELLERSSRYLVSAGQTSAVSLSEKEAQATDQLADQLTFKLNELAKSEVTTVELQRKRQHLQQDLQKIEQLEAKLSTEMDTLKSHIQTTEDEITIFCDLESISECVREKCKQLTEERVELQLRHKNLHDANQELATEYSEKKQQLSSQDTHVQLSALEKRWAHLEQTNFALKEAVLAKKEETQYDTISKMAHQLMGSYNESLKCTLSKKLPI